MQTEIYRNSRGNLATRRVVNEILSLIIIVTLAVTACGLVLRYNIQANATAQLAAKDALHETIYQNIKHKN